MARLILTSPDGRVIEVRDGDVVGRTAVGKEALDIHEEISRRHAKFIMSEGKWFVIDLNSSNGTFLNGEKLKPNAQAALSDGQFLNLSPVFQAVISIKETGKGASLPEDEAESIQRRRKTVVVLFADLKGSVSFFQEKGTLVARNWVLNLYRMLSSSIDAHRGTHIKNIGDAILAVFDDPHEAAMAALKMQEDLEAHNGRTKEEDHYYLRIGMNMGQVLFEEGDVFGNAVNIASRVQSLAPPEHIYITRCLYEEIRYDKGICFKLIGDEQLKGVKEKTGIYEVMRGGDEMRANSQQQLEAL